MAQTDVGIRLSIDGQAAVTNGLRQVTGEMGGVSRAADLVGQSFRSLAGAAGAGLSVRAFVQAADAVTILNNQLKLATGSTQAASSAYSALFDIAQRSRVSFTELGGTFASISRAGEALGISQSRLLAITESISNAVAISGGSAESARASLVQLSQGLASGALRGDELNSVMEQTPRLAKALADGLGVSTGELREMGKQGQITAAAVIKALESQSRVLSGEVKNSVVTVGQAFTQLQNSTVLAVGEFDKASGVSNTLAKALQGVSDVVQTVGAALRENETAIKTTAGALAGLASVAAVGKLASLAAGIGGVSGALVVLRGVVASLNPWTLALLVGGTVVGGLSAYADAQAKTIAGITSELRNLERLNAQAASSPHDAILNAKVKQRTAEIIRLRGELEKLNTAQQQAAAPIGSVGSGDTALRRELARLEALEKPAKTVKAGVDENAALIASVRTGAAALKAEAESAQELTTVQKEIAKLYEEISTSKHKYNLQTLLTVDAVMQEKLAFEKAIIARKEAATALAEQEKLGRAAAAYAAEIVAEVVAAQKLQDEYNATFQQSAKRVADQVQALQDEARALEISAASNISLAQAVEQVSIARLNESLAIQLSFGEDVAAAAIRKEIEARKELAGLIDTKTAREAAKDAAQDAASEWAKAAGKIQDSITDALLRGFESGKGFAESLRDTVVNMFKTLVLRPVVQAVVNPVAQAVTGALGFSGAANAATLGGGLLGGASALTGVAGIMGTSFGAGLTTGFSSLMAGSVGTGLSTAAGLAASGAVTGALGTLVGVLGPIALGIGVLSSLFGGDKNKQQNTGNATSFFDASGTLTRQDTFFGGSSANADSVLSGLQSAYAKAAAALSIGTVATAFNFGSNVRKDGSDPRFALGAYAGTSAFQQTETASSDAAISLAASRAVFAALQGSELPAYLAGVFNSLDVGGASQEQITGTLAYAQALKQVREALLETRTPLQILKDNLAAGTASLKTSAETFKGDFLAAIDAGITPEALAQWQALQSTMDQLATASGNADAAITAVTRSLADIANERARLQDQYDSLTLTSAQLVAKQRAGLDESNRALFDQVQALIDLKDAATATAEALATAAETLRTTNAARLDGATTAASDAFAGLQRAVAAQQAADNAAYQAQRAAATAAYTSQQALLQTSIDDARTSLDAVGDSVNRLKSFSSSLRSTLDGMRIAGSDAGNRTSAQAEISAALARARAGGGLPLDGQLSSALATVSKPSEQLFASFADYARDFYRTANDIASLSAMSDAQLSGAELAQATLQGQLDALEDQRKVLKDGFDDQVDSLSDILTNAQRQLDAANGINTSVLSVADAIKALDASIGALSGARASQGLATTPGVAEGRLTTIKAYMQSLADDKSLTDIQKANVLAAAARTNGVSEAEITAAWGGSAAVTRQFFANAGIPQFAVGTNRVPRDMLAMLHKDEAIVPVAYNPAVGGGSNRETAAALRALADRLDRIEANTRATAGHTAGTDRKLARVIPGNAMITEAAA